MNPGNTTYPYLFSTLEVGARTLRNRIALPATLTNFGAGNRITQRWIDFLAERARGGCGLIVTEIIAVDPEALAHGAIVTGYDDANDAGFGRVADEVHAAGSCILGQLWHPGRQQLWHPTRSPAGVSDQPDALSWTVPRVMTTEECAGVVDAYVAAARRLADCGFDGVELHGAHGYLITQFLSPWSNPREDAYGGDLEGRTRFVREIAERIRDACGERFIIGFKMPADEGVEGGIDVEEAARITARLAATGAVDLFAYGQGNFSLSLENHVPDMHFRPGHFIDLHRRMREVAGGIPVMALGRVGTPELAERIVAASTYAAAEALAESHEHVVLLTPRTDIAQAVNYCSALGVHRRLHGLEVEIVIATEPVEIRDDGSVHCRDVFSGHEGVIEDVDTVVYATPRRVEDRLARALADLSPVLIGDCLAPRNLAIAIHEGHRVGNTL